MNVFKIALRSLQHRNIGSLLTIASMALGVMLVVAVLTIYGVVERSFKANTSFGYDVIVGARGGNAQLMLNTVFYLSRPVENIPYEYYLAFRDKEFRAKELKNSIAYNSHIARKQLQTTANQMSQMMPLAGPLFVIADMATEGVELAEEQQMTLHRDGNMYQYTDIAVPLALGDYFDEKFRVVGTTPEFFSEIVLDVDTQAKFEFAQGRAFEEFNSSNGFFECVLGSTVARESKMKIGDLVYPIHGDPKSEGAHIHEQGFTIVGILKPTGTANDRVCFANLEGVFLMEDHAKPIDEVPIFGSLDHQESDVAEYPVHTPVFFSSGLDPRVHPIVFGPANSLSVQENIPRHLVRTRLPIEQREVTAILVRSYTGQDQEPEDDDPLDDVNIFMDLGMGQAIRTLVGDSQLESSLNWSFFRPDRAQKAAQAISPVYEVTALFENFVSPIRWLLLLLTAMICIVSGISILVGIYNSMAQRRHELAVMRALGAGRTKVMSIMLMESVLLALTGGFVGWIAGHGLNVLVSPWIESTTGVSLGFFTFSPGPTVETILGKTATILPDAVRLWELSIELLLIPALIVLAILVGIYPAVTAYRTDVASSLGR
ncbi:MAG TPA: ABC transporter permease [Pirellulaceae bacterium]|nr:ABC transporter permease [Pirellulaceae bacterium]HMO92063.1 ABC transporter permease [Pirellulaceae bacterium]HMP69939.1 ABC transporter permease [Pirellulaceae bacterium]